MRDDAQFIAWLALERQMMTLLVARRSATTVAEHRAANEAIDLLAAQAEPLWMLVSVRYPLDALHAAAREVLAQEEARHVE